MFSGMRPALVALFFALVSGEAVSQTNEEANLLFAQAIEAYQAAEGTSGSERTDLLRQVDALLNQIVTDHPNSIPAQFMADGRQLGPIDMEVVAGAAAAPDISALPNALRSGIVRIAEAACSGMTGDCLPEITEGLGEFVLRVAFEDTATLNAKEQIRWLFTNPGQLTSDIERLTAFEEMIQDDVFFEDLVDRVDRRVLENMARETAVDIAMGITTGVVIEALAQHYETQGEMEAAAFARTWMEPFVDISLVVEGASTATTASAGVGAAVIWTKNAYAFVQLGHRQIQAEVSGATRDQQLERIASEIDSIQRSLLSRRLTGPMFEGNEGQIVTDQMAEILAETLQQNYELQQFWLASDEAILLDTLGIVLEGAKVAAELASTVAEALAIDPGQPAGTEHANSTNALPGGVPPQVSVDQYGQVALLAELRDGFYAISRELCDLDEDRIGEAWGTSLRTVQLPRFTGGYEVDCSIVETTETGDRLAIQANCSGEGASFERTYEWQILSETQFVDFTYGPKTYNFCRPLDEHTGNTDPSGTETAGIVREDSGVWGPEIVHHNTPRQIYDCGEKPAMTCLANLGYSAKTSQFIIAAARELNALEVIPVDFHETGTIDLVITGETIAGTGELLVNGSPTIQTPAYPAWEVSAYRDPIMRNIRQRFPRLSEGYFFDVPGHRTLPNGNQRFTTEVWFTDFCRACDQVARSVAQSDYSPLGGMRAYRLLGVLDTSDLPKAFQLSPDLLQRHPKLVQYALNIRGYEAGPMDGALGPRTREALATFQREHGINQGTGQIDQRTLAALANDQTLFSNGTATQPLSTATGNLEGPGYEAANCNSPDSLLSKSQILAALSGKRVDTRPGGNRYILQIFSEYDVAGDFGTVTLKDGSRGSFEQVYRVSHGQICTEPPTGGPAYCEEVRRCNYDGRGPSIGFFENGQVSTHIGEILDAKGNVTAAATSEPKYSAEDIRIWRMFDDAGGEELRQIYLSKVFAKSNTEQFLQIIGRLNSISKHTPPSVILNYVDQVMIEFMEKADLAALVTGNVRFTNAEHGELYTLWLMNRARTMNQPANVRYEDLNSLGFKKLSPEKSAYHAIGLDETRVQKWTRSDGREYVFYENDDGRYDIVFDGKNDGTYNYCGTPACHMLLDILPWVRWGATTNDTTTAEDRALMFRKTWLYASLGRAGASMVVDAGFGWLSDF